MGPWAEGRRQEYADLLTEAGWKFLGINPDFLPLFPPSQREPGRYIHAFWYGCKAHGGGVRDLYFHPDPDAAIPPDVIHWDDV